MKVPPEITYRDVEKSQAIDTLIQEKLDKLERVCDYIGSCQIAIEKTHDRPSSGSPYRVRIDLTVPPGHEIVADSQPSGDQQYVELHTVVRDAFSRAERQLKELTSRQRESEKSKRHHGHYATALVTKIFPDQDYGFIKTLEGEDVYFHRNSVLQGDFDRIEIGTGVRFVATQGDMGLQATTVQIVNKPGASVGTSEQELIEPPLGWEG